MADRGDVEAEGQARRLSAPRAVAAVVLVALVVAFVVDNTRRVDVGFIVVHAHVALIWVLVATFLVGVVADRLVLRRRARRNRKSAS